jgi:hypothetical protein
MRALTLFEQVEVSGASVAVSLGGAAVGALALPAGSGTVRVHVSADFSGSVLLTAVASNGDRVAEVRRSSPRRTSCR